MEISSYILQEWEAIVLLAFYFFGFLASLSGHRGFSLVLLSAAAVTALLTLCNRFSTRIPLVAYWRMIPILLFGNFALMWYLLSPAPIGHVDRNTNWNSRTLLDALGICMSIFTWIVYKTFPLPVLHEPHGKHGVGTTSFIIHAKNRDISAQCWFPMAETRSIANSLRLDVRGLLWSSAHPEYQVSETNGLLDAMGKVFKSPTFLMKHLLMAKSHASWCPEIALDESTPQYPVAVYSHGMKGWRQIHHTACELLASHGFVVFAVDHAPDATITRFHGRLDDAIEFNFSIPDDGTFHPSVRRFYGEGVHRRVKDLSALLDHVSQQPTLSGKLMLDKVMMWGHSYGCSAVGAMAALDPRVASVVMLDGWMYPMPDDIRRKGSQVPVLAISSELWDRCKVILEVAQLII
jgi:dienelactone hydrolase